MCRCGAVLTLLELGPINFPLRLSDEAYSGALPFLPDDEKWLTEVATRRAGRQTSLVGGTLAGSHGLAERLSYYFARHKKVAELGSGDH